MVSVVYLSMMLMSVYNISVSEQCGSVYQWRVPEPSPGQSPVSFVFLLGGNYTGQNNFLFPPSLQSFSSHLQPHWVLHKLSDNSNYNSLNHRHSNGATLLTINERLLPTNLRTFVNKRIRRKPSFPWWFYMNACSASELCNLKERHLLLGSVVLLVWYISGVWCFVDLYGR